MSETNLDHAEEELKAFNYVQGLLVELHLRLNALNKKGMLVNTEFTLSNQCNIKIEYYTTEVGESDPSVIRISHSNEHHIKAQTLAFEDVLKILPLVE